MSTLGIYQVKIHHAVSAGNVLLTELLIAKRGTKDINPKDHKKRPLLIVAIGIDWPAKIATKSDIEMVKLLISKGADVNDPKTKPILYAAHQCKAEIVQLLIINGADLEIDCLRILRAPLLTQKPGYLETLKALLKGGADPNLADHRATSILATALDLPLTDSPLQSPDFEAARILIEAGADVNRRYGCPKAYAGSGGTTLLHRAVWRYRLDVVNFLLENEAQANALAYANPLDNLNDCETTPFMVAGRVKGYLANVNLSSKNDRHYNSLKTQYRVEDAEPISEALQEKGGAEQERHSRETPSNRHLSSSGKPPFAYLLFPNKPPVWGYHDKADAAMRMKLRGLRGRVAGHSDSELWDMLLSGKENSLLRYKAPK